MPFPAIRVRFGIARIGRKARGVMCRKRTRPVHAGARAADGSAAGLSSIIDLLVEMGVAGIIAHTIRNTDTGQVFPPAQAIKKAAIRGVNPPLKAAPTWKPSEAPL